MSEDRPKIATVLVKRAIAGSGLACGLLTAWVTLGLLSMGETSFFVRRDIRSVTPASVVRLKLTAYYPAKRGDAPNPASEELAENASGSRGAACDDGQWWEVFIRELAKYLGPGVTIRPLGEVSAGGGIAQQECSLDFGNSIGASSPVANVKVTSAGEKSLSSWPPARYVPLTIPRGVAGGSEQLVPDNEVWLSRSWQIIFPRGTDIDEAVAHVRSAEARWQKGLATVVANHLESLGEIENRLRELREKYRRNIEAFYTPWQEQQSQLIALARMAGEKSVVAQPHAGDPVLAELQAVRANLVKRRQELLMTHTAEHPATKQVESLLAEIEQEIQLRLRRDRGFSAGREDEMAPVSGTGGSWLSLKHDSAIAAAPLSGGGPAGGEESVYPAQRESDGDLSQRLALLRSQLESSEIDLQKNLGQMDAEFKELVERFNSVREGLQASIHDWELSNTCVIEPEFDAIPTSPQQIRQRPTLWALLLALVTGILAHGAVVALATGVVESQYVNSVKQLSALTQAPVFQISLPQKTTIVEGANSLSSPHFSARAQEVGNSVNLDV
ncbi:MAG: hypothetical protein ACUVQG_09480 [Thermogutta sp.]